MVDMEHKRPKEQSWLAMQEIVRILAQPEK
jgi:hypothetical protein